MTIREERLRLFVRSQARKGIAVGPTQISSYMGWNSARMNSIPGWATKIRQEELAAAGFVKINGRWQLP